MTPLSRAQSSFAAAAAADPARTAARARPHGVGADGANEAEDADGDAAASRQIALDDIALTDAFDRLHAMAESVAHWQEDPATARLRDPDAASSSARPEGAPGDRRFIDLYKAICQEIGCEPGNAAGADDGLAFQLRLPHGNFALMHSPAYGADVVAVAFGLHGDATHADTDAPSMDTLTSAADANFILGLRPGSPLICHDARGKQLLVRLDYPLAGANARHCLAVLAAAARILPLR